MCLNRSGEVKCEKPNIVVLVADDLGYGDVGIFGNRTIPTPNIDRMGREGVVFTHSLAAASLCTPSRAALMTGRYPVRYGMTSSFTNRVHLFVAQSGGLPQSETTFAKVLQSNGYKTALIGKWHLGNDRFRLGDQEHHPNRHGFDYFYGLPLTNLKDFGMTGESVVKSYFPNFYPFLASIIVVGSSAALFARRSGCRTLYFAAILFFGVFIPLTLLIFQRSIPTINSILMRNDKVIEQPVRIEGSTERFVNEAKHFIKSAVEAGSPFLLVLNFLKVHTVHKPSQRFIGKSAHGPFGDCVMELDWGVGMILDFISNDHRNTLTFFTSDNGAHLEDVSETDQPTGGYNGLLRGGKGHGAKEGGIRVPTIAHWPGNIPVGLTVNLPVSLMDFYPTILEAAGIEAPSELDGKSLIPLMKGMIGVEHHKFLFHYCGSYLHGVTFVQDAYHVWKAYFFTPKYKNKDEDKCHYVCTCFGSGKEQHVPLQLFNLVTDISETRDVHDYHPDVVKIINEAVNKHSSSIDLSQVESQFDFWNSVWKPHLQPCCNYPVCSCRE